MAIDQIIAERLQKKLQHQQQIEAGIGGPGLPDLVPAQLGQAPADDRQQKKRNAPLHQPQPDAAGPAGLQPRKEPRFGGNIGRVHERARNQRSSARGSMPVAARIARNCQGTTMVAAPSATPRLMMRAASSAAIRKGLGSLTLRLIGVSMKPGETSVTRI